jgi:branched-chain amino acid aminotransferase/4-amino-4-deoxychorismate lyase
MIPEDDRGLLLGDGLFETILVEDGQLRHFEAHVARMAQGCAVLGLAPPSSDEALARAGQALDAAGLMHGRAALRLTLTAGGGRGLERPPGSAPRLYASASPAPDAAGPVRLATVGLRRNETSPLARLKTLSYLDNVLARAEARAAGADEALLLNTRGEIACAAAANLFWIAGERLHTPALACGVLEGIMRRLALEAARELGVEALEVRAPREALDGAQALFLTNSLAGVRQIAALDGRACGAHGLVEAISSRCS